VAEQICFASVRQRLRNAHAQLWIEPNTVAGTEAFAPVLDLLDRG
jgi:hypothetical protein